jgi:hypothetical protein
METESLRTASSLRFIFTRKKKEVRVVEVKKSSDIQNIDKPKRQPGRRQAEPSLVVRTKTDKEQEILKKKAEWGKAFKFIQESKPSSFPFFLQISETPECLSDPFYLKVFREMAYGSFPKGIFYDNNRDTLVCTEAPGKRNQAVRRKKFEKYVRVCLPLRPQVDFEQRTLIPTRDETTDNWNDDNLIPPIDEDKESSPSDESHNRKVIKYIHRSYQRLELPIKVLHDNFHLSLERIYQEIKLFIYMTIDILSPKDSVLLQEDSYQTIQTGEWVTSLKPNKAWSKLSKLEHISLICQFCRQEFIRSSGKRSLNCLNVSQANLLRDIEEFVVGMYQTKALTSSHVHFDGTNIVSMDGISITFRGGLNVDKSKFIREETFNFDHVTPVIIQEYKSVDLQKISNSITKQASKYSKLVKDLTGVFEEDDSYL